MRMPGIDRPPLAPHLQAIRDEIAALPTDEWRQLMHALHGDTIRRNAELQAQTAIRVDRERSRRRPDPRQLALMGAA